MRGASPCRAAVPKNAFGIPIHGWYVQHGRGHRASRACAPVGLGGDGPGEQTAAGDHRRRSHPDDGSTLGPPRRASLGPGLRSIVSHRWLSAVCDSFAPALWAVGAIARRQATGPLSKPRWMPLPHLLYAQVVKTVRRRRLVRITHRVVFGTMDQVKQVLTACGW